MTESTPAWKFPWLFLALSLISTTVMSALCYTLNQERLQLTHQNQSLKTELTQLHAAHQTLTYELAVLKQEHTAQKNSLVKLSTCATYVDNAVQLPILDLVTRFADFSVNDLLYLTGEASQIFTAIQAFSGGECQGFREEVKTILVNYQESQKHTPIVPAPTPVPNTTPLPNPTPDVVESGMP